MVGESIAMQLTGYEIFQAEALETASFGASLHQPLIITMVAGGVVVNYTPSRRSFLRILHDSSEPVYIAFFTLTGMGLALEALLPNLPAAALVFSLRLAGISVGCYCGGRFGGSTRQHYERYWMAFITQAGVALGLAAKVANEFSFGPVVALTVTAEVVVNQLLGPILFKAAIIAVGEAHNEYAPGQTSPPLASAPSRPKPRSALLIADAADAAAAALASRLEGRGWSLARCDLGHVSDGGAPSGGSGAASRAGGALAQPLLADGDVGGGDVAEAALLRAISSLGSLEVIVLMLPTDERNLSVCRLLGSSTAALLPEIHKRQTSTPQLVIRMSDAEFESRYVDEATAAFRVTPVAQHAALPNLLAEVLHPECHWTHALDNALPGDEHAA